MQGTSVQLSVTTTTGYTFGLSKWQDNPEMDEWQELLGNAMKIGERKVSMSPCTNFSEVQSYSQELTQT